MLLRSTSIKAVSKTLVKLTTWLNFTNILHSAFASADPKRAKKTDGFPVFFVLLGSLCVKAMPKHVDKIDPLLHDVVVVAKVNFKATERFTDLQKV